MYNSHLSGFREAHCISAWLTRLSLFFSFTFSLSKHQGSGSKKGRRTEVSASIEQRLALSETLKQLIGRGRNLFLPHCAGFILPAGFLGWGDRKTLWGNSQPLQLKPSHPSTHSLNEFSPLCGVNKVSPVDLHPFPLEPSLIFDWLKIPQDLLILNRFLQCANNSSK